MESKRQVVFVFDVCGTLYDSNTTYDFLLFYFKRNSFWKYITCRIVLSLPLKGIWVILNKLVGDIGLRNFLVGLLKGESIQAVNVSTNHFVKKYLSTRKIQYTHELLSKANNNGDRIVLASGSLYPVIQAIAEVLKVDEYIASTLVQNEYGQFTGKFLSDVKARKQEFINKYSNKLVVVTDNKDDFGLIERADEAIIITPARKTNYWQTVMKNHANIKLIKI